MIARQLRAVARVQRESRGTRTGDQLRTFAIVSRGVHKAASRTPGLPVHPGGNPSASLQSQRVALPASPLGTISVFSAHCARSSTYIRVNRNRCHLNRLSGTLYGATKAHIIALVFAFLFSG